MKKKIFILLFAATMVLSLRAIALAGEWRQDTGGEKYINDEGYFYAGSWQWIDKDGDGLSECYRFNDNGYIVKNATIDGCQVNSDGAWVANGEVQKRDTSNEALLYRGTTIRLVSIPAEIENAVRAILPNTSSKDDVAYIEFAQQLGDQVYIGAIKGRNDYATVDSYLIKMLKDGSDAQILLQFPTDHEYNGFTGVLGKGILGIEAGYNNADYSRHYTYFQYNILTGEFKEVSKEENSGLSIDGAFNSADHLYYTYDKNTGELTAKNIYGETAYHKYIDFTLNKSKGSIAGPSISSLDGDIISFSITLTYGGLSNPPMGQRESTVTLNKRTNEVIYTEGVDILEVTFR